MHGSTKLLVNSYIKNPTNSLGLSGPSKSGKLKIAKYLCSAVLDIEPNEFDFKVSIIGNAEEEGIDAIRELKKELAIKPLTKNGGYGRAVIFKDFHKMSVPAQNSILKLLEEPPESTILILLVDTKNSVLPTIVSRLQWVEVKPIDIKSLKKEYGQYDETLINQSYLLSGGYLVNFEEILQDEESAIKLAVEDVKRILKLKKYERIAGLDSILNNQKYGQEEFLRALQKIYHSLVRKEISGGSNGQTKLLYSLDQINKAKEALTKYNPNPKLIFTNLFYKI